MEQTFSLVDVAHYNIMYSNLALIPVEISLILFGINIVLIMVFVNFLVDIDHYHYKVIVVPKYVHYIM